MKAQFRTKLEDTFTPTVIRTGQHSPSRIEEYWKENGFDKIYKKFRKSVVPSTILTKIDIEEIGSYFNLQGYAFGKWATQGDRYNYLAATAICLEDLNRVLHFRNNLGLNHHVGITFGARGRGTGKKGATPKAHYEPGTGVINLTRYKSRNFYLKQKKQPESHEHRFLYTGGVGSLCHELGHAIDFYGGGYLDIDAQTFSLSGGKRPYIGRKAYPSKNNVLRNLLEDVLAAACLKEKENDFSAYYKRIKNNKLASDSYKEYLLSRTELVARLFEQYVAYQLKEMGIVNTLLTQKNYQPNFYLTSKEFESVVKPFDKFLLAFRKCLNGSAPSSKPTTRRKPKAVVKPNPTTKPVVKPKPTTPAKTITVKIPVTMHTIDKYLSTRALWYGDSFSKMPDKEFFMFWKYAFAANAMVKKGIPPSDIKKSRSQILGVVGGKESKIIPRVEKEFKRRGWEKKYTLSIEVKDLPKILPKTTKEIALSKLEELQTLAKEAWLNSYARPDKAAREWMAHHKEQLLQDIKRPIILEKEVRIQKYYIKKYVEFLRSELEARSKCISSAVVSPGNFPVKKAHENNRILENKIKAFETWRNEVHQQKSKAIKSGQANTSSLLEDKLAALERYHKKLLLVNKILRDKKVVDKRAAFTQHKIPLNILEKIREQGKTAPLGTIVRNANKDFKKGRFKIPTVVLNSSNAAIRSIKKRIEEEKRHQTIQKEGNKITTYQGFKIVHNVELDRLQIVFEEKPPEEIRTILKRDRRFSWSRKNKAWQRRLNLTSLGVLETVLKEIQALKSAVKVPPKSTLPKPTLPSSKKHALPPHPVDRTALSKAIKSLEGLEQAATSAWNNSSFHPKERGQLFIREHVQELKEDVEVLVHAARRSNIDQYVAIYVRTCQKLISSQANVVSWMITGRGGSYNAKKVQKKNDRHHDKQKAFWDWRAMRLKKAQAERSTAIRGGTSDTIG
ncbi:MAG: LPD1 domain-containing protein, partial [Aureispira sp.]